VIADPLNGTLRAADFSFDHDRQAHATGLLRSTAKE
jgi:hypothetical protein